MQIDHINIRAPAPLLERVRDFYCTVLGLQAGFRPAFASAGIWLYGEGAPIVHLSFGGEESDTGAVGHLDHVAFRGSDLQAFLSRLHSSGIAYSSSYIPELGLTQLCLRDPAGTGLEVNFPGEEMP